MGGAGDQVGGAGNQVGVVLCSELVIWWVLSYVGGAGNQVGVVWTWPELFIRYV